MIIPPFRPILLAAQRGIERISDVIDIGCRQPGVVQAEADRTFGHLMRIIELRRFTVLDAVEALLLDGGNELAVDQQRCRGLMVNGIDSKDVHRGPRSAALNMQTSEPFGNSQVASQRC